MFEHRHLLTELSVGVLKISVADGQWMMHKITCNQLSMLGHVNPFKSHVSHHNSF